MKIFVIPIILIMFLCQSCVSIFMQNVAEYIGTNIPEIGYNHKTKECNFKEFISQAKKIKIPEFYRMRSLLISPFIDIGLVTNYILNIQQPIIIVISSGLYIFGSLIALYGGIDSLKNNYMDEHLIEVNGWKYLYAPDCIDDYFIDYYYKEFYVKQYDTIFIKRLLHFPINYDISQNAQFLEFYNDIINNQKIKTYKNSDKYYLYFYYKGGKEKFEKDYEKYLYRN